MVGPLLLVLDEEALWGPGLGEAHASMSFTGPQSEGQGSGERLERNPRAFVGRKTQVAVLTGGPRGGFSLHRLLLKGTDFTRGQLTCLQPSSPLGPTGPPGPPDLQDLRTPGLQASRTSRTSRPPALQDLQPSRTSRPPGPPGLQPSRPPGPLALQALPPASVALQQEKRELRNLGRSQPRHRPSRAGGASSLPAR